MFTFLTILFIIFIQIVSLGLSTLIFWGLGYLICELFAINFIWTIWHGFVIALIYNLLHNLFKGGK